MVSQAFDTVYELFIFINHGSLVATARQESEELHPENNVVTVHLGSIL